MDKHWLVCVVNEQEVFVIISSQVYDCCVYLGRHSFNLFRCENQPFVMESIKYKICLKPISLKGLNLCFLFHFETHKYTYVLHLSKVVYTSKIIDYHSSLGLWIIMSLEIILFLVFFFISISTNCIEVAAEVWTLKTLYDWTDPLISNLLPSLIRVLMPYCFRSSYIFYHRSFW